MFKHIFEELKKEVSGEIAFNHVTEISRFHRIQVSPGIREAVQYAGKTLESYGLEVDIRKYKSNGKALAWSSPMFKEWDCKEAELKLIEPANESRLLARFTENKMSIIQRSLPTPKEGVEAELAVLSNGEEESHYKGLDLKGKVVLTNGDVSRVHYLAVEKHGAIGIIYDGMWSREQKPDDSSILASFYDSLDHSMKYTSFWWYSDAKPCWGFVLTPRMGRWIRKLIENSKSPVKLHARVESKLYTGEMENCVALIPGSSNELVVVVAHICHPQPSANDNASGSGAAIEAARALQALISSGKLKKPRRSIVFTLVPEMSGTYPYLAENEAKIPDMVAALNLDMVGENQNLCGSTLIVERTPESCPSYVNSLMESIYDFAKSEAKNLGGTASYALFKNAVTPFSGGSDHYVYSDPTVGVACPMMIQWPDKFYHTSADTIDKVDPEMLRKVALMTATYAYFIADAGIQEALWVASETASREKGAILKRIQDIVTAASNGDVESTSEALQGLRDRVEYWISRSAEAVRSVNHLTLNDKRLDSSIKVLVADLEATTSVERRRAEATIRQIAEAKQWTLKTRKKRLTKLEKEASKIIPVRKYKGPVSTRQWVGKLSPEDRESFYQFGKAHKEASGLETLAVYWSDGNRSLFEISRLVELESGRRDLGYLIGYFRYLEQMGLIVLR
jgi:aminopeptidase-like protein